MRRRLRGRWCPRPTYTDGLILRARRKEDEEEAERPLVPSPNLY